MRTYIVSWAQAATPRHVGFVESMKTYCEHNDAELLLQGGRYKNPTSIFSRKEEAGEWWDDELKPYLQARWKRDYVMVLKDGKRATVEVLNVEPRRRKLAKDLTFFSDIPNQPTATHPLNGMSVFLGTHKCSAIIGHPSRAMETVATGTREPRFAFTTGACTVPNYTDSKAGKKGHAHHVIGALVVEVQDNGEWWARQVTASGPTGSFRDLDKVYSPSGVKQASRAASLTLGDIHEHFRDDDALAAAEAACELLRPKHLVVHDVLDFHARSHHVRTSAERYDRKDMLVETEVRGTCTLFRDMCAWRCQEVDVISSNHHDHFTVWLDKHDPEKDPANDPYHSRVKARRYDYRDATGTWPETLELEARHLGVPAKVRFIKPNEPFDIAGVAHPFHGHRGKGGSRGSRAGYAKLGVKTNIGHSHEPGITHGCWQAGHLSKDDHDYNNLPGAWAKSMILTHPDGKRQMLVIRGNQFRGEA